MSPLYCPFGSVGGANPAQGAASEGVQSATSGDLSEVPFIADIVESIKSVIGFPLKVLQSMTVAELIMEGISLFVAPVDLAYNLAQIANDAING
ncbi:MAG: hypothetical protein KJ043_18745, partial [Anaerolineae bacterium]|nr:hypothetical protein [Anaerolineae bacterium]